MNNLFIHLTYFVSILFWLKWMEQDDANLYNIYQIDQRSPLRHQLWDKEGGRQNMVPIITVKMLNNT